MQSRVELEVVESSSQMELEAARAGVGEEVAESAARVERLVRRRCGEGRDRRGFLIFFSLLFFRKEVINGLGSLFFNWFINGL